MKNILITGGAGYIGTHTLVELSNANHDFIVYDNLSNSSSESLKRVEKIIGKSIAFIDGDIRDKQKLQETFSSYLLEVMSEFECKKIVFSFSATVYDEVDASNYTPLSETNPLIQMDTKNFCIINQ